MTSAPKHATQHLTPHRADRLHVLSLATVRSITRHFSSPLTANACPSLQTWRRAFGAIVAAAPARQSGTLLVHACAGIAQSSRARSLQRRRLREPDAHLLQHLLYMFPSLFLCAALLYQRLPACSASFTSARAASWHCWQQPPSQKRKRTQLMHIPYLPPASTQHTTFAEKQTSGAFAAGGFGRHAPHA